MEGDDGEKGMQGIDVSDLKLCQIHPPHTLSLSLSLILAIRETLVCLV